MRYVFPNKAAAAAEPGLPLPGTDKRALNRPEASALHALSLLTGLIGFDRRFVRDASSRFHNDSDCLFSARQRWWLWKLAVKHRGKLANRVEWPAFFPWDDPGLHLQLLCEQAVATPPPAYPMGEDADAGHWPFGMPWGRKE